MALIEFGLFVLILYLINKYLHNHWTRHGFRQESPTFFVGHLGKMLTQRASVPEIFDEFYRKHKKQRFVGLYNFYRPSLFVTDTELIHDIIIRDFGSFHDHTIAIDVEKDPLSGQLFAMKGQKWRDLRIKLSPAFTSGKLKMMFPIISKCVEVMTEFVDRNVKNDQNEFSSKDLFMRFNTTVISSIAFGVENDCINEAENPFYINGKKFFETNLRNSLRMLLFMFLPSMATKFVKFAPNDVDTFFRGLIKEIVEYREKTNLKRNDFMELLLQLKNQGYVSADKDLEDDDDEKVTEYDNNNKSQLNKLTIDEVAAQAFVFFLASFETQSSTINFLLIELARNPEIQKKVQEEIDHVYATQGISYASVKNLKYLECCISETLRKYPVVPILTRECTKTYHIPNTDLVIEEGTEISLPVYSIHNDPDIFERPHEFIPERFVNSSNGNGNAKGLCYFPFGDGPRHCIGMRMAIVSIKMATSAILSKFLVELVDPKHIKQEIEFDRLMFPLTPADDIKIRVTHR